MRRRIQFSLEGRNYDMPAEWTICSDCEGEGRVSNPAFDGLSLQDEIFDDPEFGENLANGVYNVTCSTCTGTGKTLAPAWDQCSIDEIRALDRYRAELRKIEAEKRLDARMGW